MRGCVDRRDSPLPFVGASINRPALDLSFRRSAESFLGRAPPTGHALPGGHFTP
ncbi:MAG: hypothetical protein FWE28_07245 [Oscillospiraceae bacterium]|nr:hypothetical protein [Oscillospiraceae bacterium]